MSEIEALNVSRNELAHRRYGKAVERLRRLEETMEPAFEELWEAERQLRDDGRVISEVIMTPPMQAAYASFKVKKGPDG